MAGNVKKFYDFIGNGDRKEADFYPTPDWMADALFDNVPADMFNGAIWECACGDGSLAERIKVHRPNASLFSSDLFDRGYGRSGLDFTAVRGTSTDWIITNPPFSMATAFMLKAEEIAVRGWALLLPVRYLTGKTRARLFRKYGLSHLIVLPQKADFTGEGNTKLECAWFVRDKLHAGGTRIIWNEDRKEQTPDLFLAV